jgi:phytoene dehydrogenase-like protein
VAHERYDAVVVGAGMSGLAAGIRLAQYDKRVVVLDRHALWGGLNSFYKRAGRRHDTGLHALTNWAPPGEKSTPLPKLLRQLRIGREELDLAEQGFSEVRVAGARLVFGNGEASLVDGVARAFPAEVDGFRLLVEAVKRHDPFGADADRSSARARLAQWIRDPLLIECLLVPVAFYGSAREDEVEWDLFVVLFRSMFLEGLARPVGGIRTLLDALRRRFVECGGELRMRAGVERILLDERGAARGVRLDGGEVLECERVLSSAGRVETLRLVGVESPAAHLGRLSFCETTSFLARPTAELGHGATMVFFSFDERFAYRRPQGLVDATSGVVCASDNYERHEYGNEGVYRVTCLANHDLWSALPDDEYQAAKRRCADEMLSAAGAVALDPRPHTTSFDMFTPKTIRRYTGHLGGAVYGSPEKARDGHVGVERLHLVGTDQGTLGIVGSLLSGVAAANRHVLMAPTA